MTTVQMETPACTQKGKGEVGAGGTPPPARSPSAQFPTAGAHRLACIALNISPHK